MRLTNLSYHIRVLEGLGVIKLVRTAMRRGAVEHYYRAEGRLRITDQAWAQVPVIVKNAMVASTLDQATRYAHAGASIGGFEPRHAHLSRQPMILDEDGFAELAAAVKALLERSNEIEAESARRIAAGGHDSSHVSAGLVTMLFEAPPENTALPGAADTTHRQRNGNRPPPRSDVGAAPRAGISRNRRAAT